MYHLTADPLEQHNLAADPRYKDVRRELEKRLVQLSKEAGPDRMPVYEGIVNVLPKY